VNEQKESPNVLAARERDRNNVWWNRYRTARLNGFSVADSELHADQAVALYDKENGR
jgi:hypothetical protein